MITNKFQKNWLSLLINTLFEDFYGWCYKTGNSEGGSRKIPGGGEAPVGRRVRKTIGNRGVAEGHVSSRVYEVLLPSSVAMSRIIICSESVKVVRNVTDEQITECN